MKLDLDYKDEKISALSKELEDLHSGGTTDEEVSSLKRQKNDLEKRLKDQVRRVPRWIFIIAPMTMMDLMWRWRRDGEDLKRRELPTQCEEKQGFPGLVLPSPFMNEWFLWRGPN